MRPRINWDSTLSTEVRSGDLAGATAGLFRALWAWPLAPFDAGTYRQLVFYAARMRPVDRDYRRAVAALIRSLRPINSGVDLIRLGSERDGGYLVPDDLGGIRYAFSPGVGGNSEFEADLADRGMTVFLADGSVSGPAQPHPKFVFEKRHLSVRSSASTVTMDDWKTASIGEYTGDLLLQMDIESAEYKVLASASSTLLSQFRVIVVEFHGLHRLWNRRWFRRASSVFATLLATHAVVHVHPNNSQLVFKSQGVDIPPVAEFTFLRKDRVLCKSPAHLPHALDRDTLAGRASILWPTDWCPD